MFNKIKHLMSKYTVTSIFIYVIFSIWFWGFMISISGDGWLLICTISSVITCLSMGIAGICDL